MTLSCSRYYNTLLAFASSWLGYFWMVLLTVVPMILGSNTAIAQTKVTAVSRSQPHSVTVNVLAYATGNNGKAFGTCSPMMITVGGRPAGQVRIGFIESEVGGTGDMWRSAGWTASVTAAQLNNFDDRTRQVTFDLPGRIDGPSAGALMTIGVLAASRGETVRSDAAMTGTINPDGIIGPVGGIAHKIEGAAAAGKKLVLIPAGIRFGTNMNTRKKVDLIKHGKKLGVTVRPVLDIYTAYKLMTGKDLPAAPLAKHARVSDAANDLVLPRIKKWASRLKVASETYQKLPQAAHSELGDAFLNSSLESLKVFEKLMQEGYTTAAYREIVNSAVTAYYAMELGRCVQTYQTHGFQSMLTRLKNNGWLQKDIERINQEMRSFRPKTYNQLAVYFQVCDAFFEALALQKMAQAKLNSITNQSEQTAETALEAAQLQIVAWLDLKLAKDYLELAKAYQGKEISPNAPIISLAKFYRQAAIANVQVFDSLVINEEAKTAGISPQKLKRALVFKDQYYGMMYVFQSEIMPNLSRYFPDDDQFAEVHLAASLYVHLRAAMLVAKYYSLNAKLDKDLNIVGLARMRTFSNWLDRSEQEARCNVGFLKKQGLDVTALSQVYEVSRHVSDGELADRLNALTLYFNMNVHSHVLRHLAGFTLPEKQQE